MASAIAAIPTSRTSAVTCPCSLMMGGTRAPLRDARRLILGDRCLEIYPSDERSVPAGRCIVSPPERSTVYGRFRRALRRLAACGCQTADGIPTPIGPGRGGHGTMRGPLSTRLIRDSGVLQGGRLLPPAPPCHAFGCCARARRNPSRSATSPARSHDEGGATTSAMTRTLPGC